MNLASIVWDVDPVLVRIGSIELRWYGLMCGDWALSWRMKSWRACLRKKDIPTLG